MAPKIAQLRSTPDDELIRQHDETAHQYPTTVNYYLEELARRRADRQGKQILALTWVIAILTLVNVAAIVIDIA